MFGLADDVRPALARACEEGRPVALATIFQVVGGSPRPAGSQMLIDRGEPHGFLSGGCIEADVCLHAAHVLEAWTPMRLTYGEASPYKDIQLACGGRIDILLEPLAPQEPAVRTLLDLVAERQEAVWVSDGVRRVCLPADQIDAPRGWSAPLLDALSSAEIAGVVQGAGAALAFREPPPRRVVIVGHDPIAIAIAAMALQTGYETWLVRPRGPSQPPPLPGLRYDARDAEVALAAIGLDPWTHVAVATHDLEADEPALITALASNASYVGVLGARRRLPERLARLRARGVGEAALARLHAPIGLDLGGKAPLEIGVAVLAEIIREEGAWRPHVWIQVDGPARPAIAADLALNGDPGRRVGMRVDLGVGKTAVSSRLAEASGLL